MNDTLAEGWTDSELAIARDAFDRAYERAIDQLVLAVRTRSAELSSVDRIGRAHV